MNHLFRLFWLFFTAGTRQPLGPENLVCRTQMRVWPTDLDVLMHMNNGVYLSLMDLGRTDLMLRMGAARKLGKLGIYPVLASEAIRFKKSLKVFRPFTIETRILGWDDKYFYLVQKFLSKGDLCASAIVKARFLKKSGGKVSPEELLEIIGMNLPKPGLDPSIDQLVALEENLRD